MLPSSPYSQLFISHPLIQSAWCLKIISLPYKARSFSALPTLPLTLDPAHSLVNRFSISHEYSEKDKKYGSAFPRGIPSLLHAKSVPDVPATEQETNFSFRYSGISWIKVLRLFTQSSVISRPLEYVFEDVNTIFFLLLMIAILTPDVPTVSYTNLTLPTKA